MLGQSFNLSSEFLHLHWCVGLNHLSGLFLHWLSIKPPWFCNFFSCWIKIKSLIPKTSWKKRDSTWHGLSLEKARFFFQNRNKKHVLFTVYSGSEGKRNGIVASCDKEIWGRRAGIVIVSSPQSGAVLLLCLGSLREYTLLCDKNTVFPNISILEWNSSNWSPGSDSPY